MANDGEVSVLTNLVGEQLSSVTFVQDYVQLSFDGPCLTLFTWPVVIISERAISKHEQNYKDALCAQIGIQIASTILNPSDCLTILFSNSIILQVSLKDEDYVAAEAVMFQSDQGWWVL